MKAMLLAGGLSTRLYPLTKTVPKPLVPVAGVPNAIHLIKYLKSFGYDEIAINVHYLADAITSALGDGSAFGVRLEYLHEATLMGSAGALKPMERFFGNETFVVVGCDDLTDLPLDRTRRDARSQARCCNDWFGRRASRWINTASWSPIRTAASPAFKKSPRPEPSAAKR